MPVELNYTKIGEGPALIVLHGLFGSASNWRSIANKLSDEFTVYTLDARNHGESPWADSMSYMEMAEDIANFIDQHQINNANVVGHSMGGKTAMTFALNHPEKLNKLVIADIAPKAYSHGGSHKYYIDNMLKLDLEQLQGRKEAELYLTEQLNEPKPVIQFLLQNLIFKDNRYKWRINLNSLDQNLASIMGEIPAPGSSNHSSLFLYGENSNYVQLTDHELINSLFKQCSIQSISNAGHWLHAEQPVEFTRKIREFLSDSSGNM